MAAPLAPHGVTVDAVAPALIEGGAPLPGDEEAQQQLAEWLPVGRLGRPEEVAETVLSLISNPFLSVDGGPYPR